MFPLIVISVALLSTVTDVVSRRIPDGITIYKTGSTWAEAKYQCQIQSTILASPINQNRLDLMKSLIGTKTYYIGTKKDYFHQPGRFISLEGIPLENMNVFLWKDIHQSMAAGDCLAMTSDKIHAVSCETRLPYICYNTSIPSLNMSNCSPGYKFDLATKLCYKLHTELTTWIDAQMTCVSEGGHLAVITDTVKAESIKNIYGRKSYMWTGLRDYSSKGDWFSVHWQRVETLYDAWLTGYKPADAPCGVFYLPGYYNRAECDSFIDFICEKAPTF